MDSAQAVNEICRADKDDSGANTSPPILEFDDGMVVVGGSMWFWKDYIALLVPDDYYDAGRPDDGIE